MVAFLSRRFRCAWKKVGTFSVHRQGGRLKSKRGGSVASYFLTPDGRVLGAVLGAVDAETFLEEARWALQAHADPGAAHRARAEHLKTNRAKASAVFT